MTAPAWADRSLSLAERVRMAIDDYPCWPDADDPEALALLTELLADVAAADRLARATEAHQVAQDKWITAAAKLNGTSHRSKASYDRDLKRYDVAQEAFKLTDSAYSAALAAYRVRMAQGVTHG